MVDAAGDTLEDVGDVGDAAIGFAGKPVSFAAGIGEAALPALAAAGAGEEVVAGLAGGALAVPLPAA